MECQTIEWKEAWRDEYMRTLCAFANMSGGTLEIGRRGGGRLPETWTVENLLAPHTSKPYNPLIAGAFFRSGQIEAWGRGIEKIAEARRFWGQAGPFYQIRPNEVMIGFNVDPVGIVGSGVESVGEEFTKDEGNFGKDFGKNSVVNNGLFGVNGADGAVNAAEFGVNGVNGGEKFGVNEENFGKDFGVNDEKFGVNDANGTVNDDNGTVNGADGTVNGDNGTVNNGADGTVNVSNILQILSETPKITYDEISIRLNMPRRTVAREIKALREQGIIKRIGSDKTGHWVVKT